MTVDELIAALEAAEWPMSISRRADLDCAIHSLLRDPANYQPLTNDRIPDYVGSIDDALTLVPHEKLWSVDCWGNATVALFKARHRSPVIALCIAALKARRP